MRFYTSLKTRRATPKYTQRFWRRPLLEGLEDRVVPSLPDGTLLVATAPSPYASTSQSSFPTGIIGVNPSTGGQFTVSTGNLFTLPTYTTEAPNGQLYVSDLSAFVLGAVIGVDPNSGTQTLLTKGQYINGPNALAFVNGFIYVATEGDGTGKIHSIIRIDPNTGIQTLITDGPTRIDGGTNSSFFSVPTGMVPAPGNNVYLADEPGNFTGTDPGKVWEINLDTGAQRIISSNNSTQGTLFNHPVDVAVDPSGNIIVANTGGPANNVAGSVIRINPRTGVQTLVTSFGQYSGTDSVEVGPNGTIYVGAIAGGTNPGQVIAVNPGTGAQQTLTSAGNLSLVEGMRIFHATVQTTATTTTVTSSANSSVFGQSVTFTATVTASAGGTPTGTVQFQVEGTNFGSPVGLSSGVATSAATSGLSVSGHTVMAVYSGDTNFATSTGTLTQTVTKASTTATLSSSANPSTSGQSVTFTATISVTAPGAGTPTGTVQFQIDGASAGSAMSLSSGGTATFSTASLAVGTHTVSATYSGNSNFTSSTGTLSGGQVVNKPAPTTTTTAVSSSANPSVFGQSVTFTATVTASAGGTPTGTVQFQIDGRNFGSAVSLNSGGTATVSTASLGVGTHTVSANYSGDSNFTTSTGTLSGGQVVNNPALTATTTTVSSSANPLALGQSVTFTATVTPSGSGAAPTGTVQWQIDGTNMGSPVAVSTTGGVTTAILTTSTLSGGTHTITASYSGDSNYQASSGSLQQTVNTTPGSTTTTVTSSANPQTAGQPVSWTATVTAATGSVNLVNFETGDFSQAATHTNGAIVTSPVLDGTYSLQLQRSNSVANYEIRQTGTTYYNLRTVFYSFLFQFASQTGEGGVVNFQDTSSGYKAAIHLSAAGKLLFYDINGNLLGIGTTTLNPNQTYTISAKIGTGTNVAWEIRLNGNVEMSGTGNLGANNNGSIKLGGNGAYTTTYYYDDVAINSVPTGTVQFAIDGTNFGAAVPLSNGSATSGTTSTLSAGNHVITASYSGDSTYAQSTGTLSGGQTINSQTTTSTSTAVVSSANPSAPGQSVTFTATVTPGGSGAAPTGTVQWQIDGTNMGSPVAVSTTGGVTTATLMTSTLSGGTHTITASYSGDSNYQPSSGSLQQTVNTTTTAGSTTTVTSSANPQTAGQPVSWTATVTTATGLVNFVNFETGDFSQAATHTNGAIVTSPALNGTYSLQLQRSNSVANVEIRQSGTTYYNLPTVFYRFLFESTFNPSEASIVNFQDTAGVLKGALHLSADNKLLFENRYGTTLATGTTGLASGQIYALSAMIGTGTNAAWEIRINGNVEMSGTGNLGANNNGSIKLGGNNGYTTTYYYDDVAINSQAYPGPVPTGTVQFAIDGMNFGAAVTLSDGSATSETTSMLSAGNHVITASYSGDSTYAQSTGTLAGGQTISSQSGQVNFVDFETGNFSQTATHTNGAIVTSPALDGMYSLQLRRSNSVAYVEIRQSGTTYYDLPTAYYSFLFEWTSNPAEGGICNFQNTVSGYKCALHLSAANTLLFYGSSGTLVATGTTVLASGQIYTLSAMIGTGTNAAWEIRINDNVEMSGTGNLGADNGSIKLGGNQAYTTNYYYDDVAINSLGYPGGAAAAPGRPLLPVLLVGPAQALNAGLASEAAFLSSGNLGTLPQTVPVLLPSQLGPLQSAGADAGSTRWPEVNHGLRAQAAVDSFFADWGLAQGLTLPRTP